MGAQPQTASQDHPDVHLHGEPTGEIETRWGDDGIGGVSLGGRAA